MDEKYARPDEDFLIRLRNLEESDWKILKMAKNSNVVNYCPHIDICLVTPVFLHRCPGESPEENELLFFVNGAVY